MFFDHTADENDDALRARFNGVAPLFPLGNLTLLPHVVQPFHMFEPRYRQLAEDAVAGEGFISLGILKPSDGDDYESKVGRRVSQRLLRWAYHAARTSPGRALESDRAWTLARSH